MNRSSAATRFKKTVSYLFHQDQCRNEKNSYDGGSVSDVQSHSEDRPTDLPEKMVDGYIGFLFRDKDGMPLVAMHWEHRFNSMVGRYNNIYRVQMPNITPHVCRHTYCSNMARAGMNPKTLQYLMGHSDISVTMNTYTHLGLDDAKDEMIRLQELEDARKEVEKTTEKPKAVTQSMFRAV